MIHVQRSDIRLKPDPRRVILKFLNFVTLDRFHHIFGYAESIDEVEAERQLAELAREYAHRHFNLKTQFYKNVAPYAELIPADFSETKKQLIGAFFTHEYSIEAAALFNPSIVLHPDQSGLPEGTVRFVMSLRAVGEGHISSIAFQTGTVNQDGKVQLEPVGKKVATGTVNMQAGFSKDFVLKRLRARIGVADKVVDVMPERFNLSEIINQIEQLEQREDWSYLSEKETLINLFSINYNLNFDADIPLSSRVVFPNSYTETNGIEDVRFVEFTDGGESVYYGTYTAYNGRDIRPQLIETTDFQRFKVRPFYGKAASNKGMALFPEKINGKYAMIGRQGGRDISIMYSDDVHFWEEYEIIQRPERDWEMLQMGNCGSPIKTEKGWLLLTHGVAAMRKYTLSLTLLDLENPTKVIGSLEQPLMSPNEEEREGYVPNVLYTCGMLEHAGRLVIPYAMSDYAISFATVKVEEVLTKLT